MNVNNASWSHDYWLLKGDSLLSQTAGSTDNDGLGTGLMLLCGGRQSPSTPKVGNKDLTNTHWVQHTNGLNWVGYFSSEMIKYLGLEWKLNAHFLLLYYTATLRTHYVEFHTCIYIFGVADLKKWALMKELKTISYFQREKIMKSTEIWSVLIRYILCEK